MKKIAFTFLFFLVFTTKIFADTEAPTFPYTAETADKKYIFVILTPNCELCWGSDRYKQSGMYLNDGSTTPLWTVDWQNYVFLPSDGKHIVRKGKWTRYSATYREEVFSFISEGSVLKTYKAVDLIDFPFLLPHSSSHYKAIRSSFDKNSPNDGVMMKLSRGEDDPINSGVNIDNINQTIQIETLHGDKYLFDLKTGNILSSYSPSRNAAIGLFCALAVVYFGYLFLATRINLTKRAFRIANYTAGFFLTLFLFLIPIISVWLYKIPLSEDQPDYLDFLTLCYMQISTFPRYLFTALNIISQPENNLLSAGYEAIFNWLMIFWIPCILLFGFLNQFFTTKLSKNNFQ